MPEIRRRRLTYQLNFLSKSLKMDKDPHWLAQICVTLLAHIKWEQSLRCNAQLCRHFLRICPFFLPHVAKLALNKIIRRNQKSLNFAAYAKPISSTGWGVNTARNVFNCVLVKCEELELKLTSFFYITYFIKWCQTHSILHPRSRKTTPSVSITTRS